MSSKKIAITGGTGFIGKKLAIKHIALGDEVRVLSRKSPFEMGLPSSVQWFRGDLTCADDLTAFADEADVLYHCAGEVRDPSQMERLHVGGTGRLIKAASGRIGRWVQLSSVGVYGRQRSGVVTEEMPCKPIGIYEITKNKSDDLVAMAGMTGAFKWTILRPSNVYGTNMTNRSLFGLIEIIRRRRFFFIGKPGASANYIHVDNVVAALLLCGINEKANQQILNLSDYRTMESFVSTIAALLVMQSPMLRIPEPVVRYAVNLLEGLPKFPLTMARVDALTGRALYSTEKIERLLGYQHRVSMESGLAELTEHWVSNIA